jgi:transposase
VPNPRPPYPPEFRSEAVRLYRSSGKSLKAVADELGISLETLRTWVQQAEIDAGTRAGLSSSEREHMAELEKENRELRKANQILKEASVFFASELDRPRR